MAEGDWLTAAFEQHREHLRGVAYRLLGSMTDAEDAVQETWLRLTGTDAAEVANLGGWLTTVTARISLNLLRSRRHRHEQPFDDEWPGAVSAGTGAASGAGGAAGGIADPEDEAVLAESVGLALLVVLDTLTPGERLAFVLHDLFGMPFSEVAGVLDRSAEAARQLASRARRRVRGAPVPGYAADLARQREVAAAFLAATRGGDLAALVSLLDSGVTLTGDGAAVPSGRPVVVHGRDVVARGAMMSAARAAQSELALVDGTAGIVFAPAGRLRLVLRFTVGADRAITGIDVIADPGRLRRLRLAVLPG